jgi:hypothetical protein
METWGGCIGAVSFRSASNRHGYTAVVLRLCGDSDVPRQLACGSPLSAVQRGWQAAWAERAEQRTANDNSQRLQPTTTANDNSGDQSPSIASTANMPQPPRSSASRQPSRARCCYTSSVLNHTPVGPDLRQRDATTTLWLGLEEQGEGASRRQPAVSCVLTHRQTPAEPSASLAATEPAAAVAHGLQVVAEGTNPTVEYASCCPVARSQLTRLQYRRRPWPGRTPREDMDDEQRRQLAARPPPARPAQRAHTQLGLRCEHT